MYTFQDVSPCRHVFQWNVTPHTTGRCHLPGVTSSAVFRVVHRTSTTTPGRRHGSTSPPEHHHTATITAAHHTTTSADHAEHGHHQRTRPGRFRTSRPEHVMTSTRAAFHRTRNRPHTAVLMATPSAAQLPTVRHGHILPRFAPTTATTSAALIAAHTAQKKPPHGIFSGGGCFLFSYKFHYLIGGFSVTRTDKFCFGK